MTKLEDAGVKNLQAHQDILEKIDEVNDRFDEFEVGGPAAAKYTNNKGSKQNRASFGGAPKPPSLKATSPKVSKPLFKQEHQRSGSVIEFTNNTI